jgi:hypothetical protein
MRIGSVQALRRWVERSPTPTSAKTGQMWGTLGTKEKKGAGWLDGALSLFEQPMN